MSLCQVVRGYALVWPVIRGVTLSDYGMATGFDPFNLPTCGPLPKGRDHSHVDSGKHIYVCIVYCCGCFVFLSFVVFSCAYHFSRTKLWLQVLTLHVQVYGKLWKVCILGFTGIDSH